MGEDIPPGLRARVDQAVAHVDADLDGIIENWREMVDLGMDPEKILAGFVVASESLFTSRDLVCLLGVAVRRLANRPEGSRP